VTKGSRSKITAGATGDGVGLRKSGVNVLPAARGSLGVAEISSGLGGCLSRLAGRPSGLARCSIGVAGISIRFLLEPGIGVASTRIGLLLDPVAGIVIRFLRGVAAGTVELIMMFGAGAPGSGP